MKHQSWSSFYRYIVGNEYFGWFFKRIVDKEEVSTGTLTEIIKNKGFNGFSLRGSDTKQGSNGTFYVRNMTDSFKKHVYFLQKGCHHLPSYIKRRISKSSFFLHGCGLLSNLLQARKHVIGSQYRCNGRLEKVNGSDESFLWFVRIFLIVWKQH